MNASQLKRIVVRSLRSQGYRIERGRVLPPEVSDKADLRRLHAAAVRHNIELARGGLERMEERLLARVANGVDVDPSLIHPRLIEVQPDTEDELLFRYARLHWSVPVSAGYGRRVRFLVVDQSNDKLLGLFG